MAQFNKYSAGVGTRRRAEKKDLLYRRRVDRALMMDHPGLQPLPTPYNTRLSLGASGLLRRAMMNPFSLTASPSWPQTRRIDFCQLLSPSMVI